MEFKEQNHKKDSKTIKQAAALKYDPDEDIAPLLIAKGSGYVAEILAFVCDLDNKYKKGSGYLDD